MVLSAGEESQACGSGEAARRAMAPRDAPTVLATGTRILARDSDPCD
jgi:hypothetical protein